MPSVYAEKEQDDHFTRFNLEGYHLNRASAWIGATEKTLRSSEHAFDALSWVPPDESRKRRFAYSTYLQARSWFEKGEYPFATQLALDTVSIANEIDSQVNINRVANVYQDLLMTSYKNSTEVAALGLELIRAQHKEIFV